MIWANLIHLSFNMWEDRSESALTEDERRIAFRCYRPYLRFDEELWRELLVRMSKAGFNMVVLDLGDGVKYRSHPEIAVENAWSTEKLREELDRVRGFGLEPIPKLNFATSHDAWLGEYSKCVSTPKYYRACSDLIEEVSGLFDSPRFFHIGMDEETAAHQHHYAYLVVRQHELFRHDFDFLCGEVERRGARPWVWSDHIWNHRDEYLDHVPRSVLQSNWYYGEDFSAAEGSPVRSYIDLDSAGYRQIPTASNHSSSTNFRLTADWCRKHLSTDRLLGFLQTTWRPTTREYADRHISAIEQVAEYTRIWFEL